MINPSSMKDRQFLLHVAKIESAFIELVTAELSISEGLTPM